MFTLGYRHGRSQNFSIFVANRKIGWPHKKQFSPWGKAKKGNAIIEVPLESVPEYIPAKSGGNHVLL